MSETTLIADAGGVRSMIDSMIREIIQKQPNKSLLGIVGIQTRGAVLARRIKFILDRELKTNIPFGALDITFYRDDLQKISSKPLVRSTEIEFNLNDRHVILVDDVLYTGRTVRAALDEIMDFGRPAMIRLAVLVDRGHRELPIAPDYCGNTLTTETDDVVKVCFKETDSKDEILISKGVVVKMPAHKQPF
jgi:pyrimidine operon attenuation protein/uracil phosphoribosyltransferase